MSNRFQRIYDIGCICCRMQGWWHSPCQAHHLNLDQHAGQQRLGDDHTIGLCPWHHQGEPIGPSQVECRAIFGPSMKHEPKAFRLHFGDDAELLRIQNGLIKLAETLKVGRAA